MTRKFRQRYLEIRRFLTRDIWDFRITERRRQWRRLITMARVLSLTANGVGRNRLLSRAAALSYSSLIGLGPLIALTVLISGTFLKTDPEIQIKRALLFVSPTLKEYVNIPPDRDAPPPDGLEMDLADDIDRDDEHIATALDTLISQIVDGAEQTFSNIDTSGSGVFGIFGLGALIFVAIQLLTSIETTFNGIWGVRRGRAWGTRVLYYWGFITLGGVLGLGSTALLSASTIVSLFEWVPYSEGITYILVASLRFTSIGMLILLLTFIYAFFPNTAVSIRAALIGAVVTAALLFLNNTLSIVYVQRVIAFQSLYGTVGIVPVLMFGLYFFWVFILLGGQLTYAVQNVNYLTNQQAWNQVSPRAKESLALASFLIIARRYHNCQRPPSATEIGKAIRVPGNVLNETLTMLSDVGWITSVQPRNGSQDGEDVFFQPARPLSRVNLAEFRKRFEEFGNESGADYVVQHDPIIVRYFESLQPRSDDADILQKPIEEVLNAPDSEPTYAATDKNSGSR